MKRESEVRILLIEDHAEYAAEVASILRQAAFCVDVAIASHSVDSIPDITSYQLIIAYTPTFDFTAIDSLRNWQRNLTNTPLLYLYPNSDSAALLNTVQVDREDRVLYKSRQPVLSLAVLVDEMLAQQQSAVTPAVLAEDSAESPEIIEALKSKNSTLVLLNTVGQKMAATHDWHSIIVEMLENVKEIIKADEACLWVWEDDTRQALVCDSASNPEMEEKLKTFRLKSGEGVAGWVVEHELSTISFDSYTDPRFSQRMDQKTGYTTRSIMAVPLRYSNQVIGVLQVLNKKTGVFTSEDAVLAETLAASATIALENARLLDSLQRKQVELETRNRELDAFAGTIAHDLKGPLTLAMNNFYLLVDGQETDGEEQKSFVDGVERNMDKMVEIIDEMFLFASLSSAEVDRQPIDMMAVVVESFEQLNTYVLETGAELHIPTSWPAAVGHAPWVERVWVNYMSNALKYGGDPPVIRLGFDNDHPDRVKFWIMDNGKGLSEEDLTGLFKPFPKFRDRSGHGLGLSIVDRLISKMGGSVSVKSTPGQGSCFAFSLPRE